MDPTSMQHSGLLVQRPFNGKYDEFQSDIDDAVDRFGMGQGLSTIIMNEGNEEQQLQQLCQATRALLPDAALPDPITKQIYSDTCALGKIVGCLIPSARKIVIKLEMFGASSCSRWHRDNYVGRAIVSYTGKVGTEYTSDDNVNFWELENCGNNDHIIQDLRQIRAVDTGDFLFIKGTNYPRGAKGIVHKSPANCYHKDGRIINRLILKVDVIDLDDWEFDYS